MRGTIEARLELSEERYYDIYVSTTDLHGKPSASKLTLLEPHGRRQLASIPVLPAIGRAVAFRRLFGRRAPQDLG